MTVSVGVAVSNDTATDLASLLKEADEALYRAKETGRNCVEVYSSAAEHAGLRKTGRAINS